MIQKEMGTALAEWAGMPETGNKLSAADIFPSNLSLGQNPQDIGCIWYGSNGNTSAAVHFDVVQLFHPAGLCR